MNNPDEAPACIGCGWCCLHDQCDLSIRLYGYQKRCPDIYWSATNTRYLCKQVAPPENTEARTELFIGCGCCNRFSPWRTCVINREEAFSVQR